jgi:hypothetical protein
MKIPALLLLLISAAGTVAEELPMLIVSAYFPVANSKHSQSEYFKWMSKFLTKIESPIYRRYTTTVHVPCTLPSEMNTYIEMYPVLPGVVNSLVRSQIYWFNG